MTKRDFTVKRYGTDSSGRGIFLTAFMHDWIKARQDALGFELVIVQGSFMTRNGGGAKDSSGYHDQGGCVDFRTRDLSKHHIDAMVREFRDHGGAVWRRDQTAKHGGMDPHAHLTLGDDYPLSPGAVISWNSYTTGGDGLAGPGRDYEYRPHPLVLEAPEEDMNTDQLLDALESPRGQAALAKAVLKSKVNVTERDGTKNPRYVDGVLQALYNDAAKS